MIKAPFNFVPLSDIVVFPDWAYLISHDIPFSDAISGSLSVKVRAVTPIFVRNGYNKDVDRSSDEFKSFSKTADGQFFIPATSIKGELRHILEIISFSKMQRIDNKRYSIRDLNNKEYRDSLPYESIHCGWMTLYPNGEIAITDNGIPYRISHQTLDEKLGTDFCTLFGEDATIRDANRTGEYKYEKCPDILSSTYNFSEYKIYPNSQAVDKRIGVYFNEQGNISGKIVFSGQPGNRKERKGNITASGKFFEFVFKDVDSPHVYRLDVKSELFKDFEFIYKDSTDWSFWKKEAKIHGRSIPVFFKIENQQIHSIGLSYLYKLPYDKRVKDFLNEVHKKKDYDLSECIFGEISSEQSLKGRVHISHAICTDEIPFEYEDGIAPYMGSPKPSYYPIYLEQPGENGYLGNRDKFSTMMDRNAKLRGWKIYPARTTYQTEFDVESNQMGNTNPGIPLGTGSEFQFCIKFHNLRKIELGALLYATMLQQGSCHTLGFGKAFGYGACTYHIENAQGFKIEDINDYIKAFTDYMESHVHNYSKSPQIRELMLMMNPSQAGRLKRPLEYMELKEFVECKKHNPKREQYGEFLPRYSQLLKPVEQNNIGSQLSIAEVTFFSGGIKQAKLTEGKDRSVKLLDMNGKKDKLKIGDRIEVELIKKGKELKFIKKK